jgi:hypothetical protein
MQEDISALKRHLAGDLLSLERITGVKELPNGLLQILRQYCYRAIGKGR